MTVFSSSFAFLIKLQKITYNVYVSYTFHLTNCFHSHQFSLSASCHLFIPGILQQPLNSFHSLIIHTAVNSPHGNENPIITSRGRFWRKLVLCTAVKVPRAPCPDDLCSVTCPPRSPFLSLLQTHGPSFISSNGLHSFF